MKPKCLCSGRDVRCDEDHCDLASPPGTMGPDKCVICWQYHYSAAHRKMWGGEGPAKEPSIPQAKQPEPVMVKSSLRRATVKTKHAPVITPIHNLGDKVKKMLDSVGITQERAAKWLGCGGCPARQKKMNELSNLAEQAITAPVETVKGWLSKLMGE